MHFFHGAGKKRSYFEGWYFKHQNDTETIAFIPGIHMDSQGKPGAFIQVITNSASYRVDYPYEKFAARKDKLLIRIGDTVFSDQGIKIRIESPDLICRGELLYGPLMIPEKDFMGPFRYLPFMECSHGVVSMAHSVYGEIKLTDKRFQGADIQAAGGRIEQAQGPEIQAAGDQTKQAVKILFGLDSTGYIETDWGSSFPECYAWAQCSRFPGEDCSIMAAGALIPLPGITFWGTTCFIRYKGKESRLATYLGGRVETCRDDSLVITQGKKRLEILVFERAALPLAAPIKGDMIRSIHESASCRARFRYWDGNSLIFDLESRQAGYEYSVQEQPFTAFL